MGNKTETPRSEKPRARLKDSMLVVREPKLRKVTMSRHFTFNSLERWCTGSLQSEPSLGQGGKGPYGNSVRRTRSGEVKSRLRETEESPYRGSSQEAAQTVPEGH